MLNKQNNINTVVTDEPCFLAVGTPCTLFDISVTFGPMSKFLIYSRPRFYWFVTKFQAHESSRSVPSNKVRTD
jgi:hypothetical protein